MSIQTKRLIHPDLLTPDERPQKIILCLSAGHKIPNMVQLGGPEGRFKEMRTAEGLLKQSGFSSFAQRRERTISIFQGRFVAPFFATASVMFTVGVPSAFAQSSGTGLGNWDFASVIVEQTNYDDAHLGTAKGFSQGSIEGTVSPFTFHDVVLATATGSASPSSDSAFFTAHGYVKTRTTFTKTRGATVSSVAFQ